MAYTQAAKEAQIRYRENHREELRRRRLERYREILADPVLAEEYKRKRAIIAKRKYDKAMADPQRKAAYRAASNRARRELRRKTRSYSKEQNAWLQNVRSDPQRFAQYLEKQRIYKRKYHAERMSSDQQYRARHLAKSRRANKKAKESGYFREWTANRRAIDPQYKIYSSLVKRVGAYLGRRNNRPGTVELLGCTVAQLKSHLESKFQPNMSWDTYGQGFGKWGVDHIKPCASFNMMDPDQVKQAFHWSNLQPMWNQENAAKNSRHAGRRWFRANHQIPVESPCPVPANAV